MTGDNEGLAQVLEAQRDHIVSRFVAEVQRKDLSPPGVAQSLLVDHIPRFLDEVIQELTGLRAVRVSHDAIDSSETARRHGGQRWALGYDLEALVREYGILRHCIIEIAKQSLVPIDIDEFDVLAKCLSVGVAEAAAEYIKYRDEQLNAQKANLEFLAEAGEILSSSLDYRSTLSRLTALVVPRLADCCIVHLEDNDEDEVPIAHVDPKKVELVREIHRKFQTDALPYGRTGLIRIGEARLTTDVHPEQLDQQVADPARRALLEQLDVRSWMAVPLRVQGNTFGSLLFIYADSGRRYTKQELVLASELARRAGAAIDNARLYDLSQRERSRVEAVTRAKDEFVAMVSHELRTPLNAILGWIRLMRSGALDEPRKAHAFDVIERNAEAQNRLVADLLDISRAITGKIRINASQVNLGDVIEMAVEGIRPAADAKRIRIDVDIDRDNAVLRGDGDRLQQVVWNLLSNGVKFTPKNGLIRVRTRRIDSDVEVSVEDNGPGIGPEFLPHIFESFRQSESSTSRGFGGLGIGLSIAKHIVELHGGSIEATSPGKGGGSTFVFRLPISPLVSAAPRVSGVRATRPQSVSVSLPTSPAGIRILVVDDEPDARELVACLLETCGMEVRTAATAAEALRELDRYAPHVVLSDVGMAGEDGYALIRSIRTLRDEDKRQIPAIALTAYARNEDRTRALVEGFNVHMAKPVEPAALVRAVIDLAGGGEKSPVESPTEKA